jgi:hypothetical protein
LRYMWGRRQEKRKREKRTRDVKRCCVAMIS